MLSQGKGQSQGQSQGKVFFREKIFLGRVHILG